MGHFIKSPIYLDKTSLLTDAQIKAVNSSLKSQYNRMMSQGFQKQKEKPSPDTPYSAYGRTVDNLVCYSINDLAIFSCNITLNGDEGEEFTVVETDMIGSRLVWSGVFDDTDLSNVATVYVSNKAIKIRLLERLESKTAQLTIWLYPRSR